jgi:proline racemase
MPIPAIRSGRVESVAIDMVPSFVFDTGREMDIPGFGKIPVDLVCVGGFFAMVSARSVGIELVPANSHRLIPLGMAIIEAANKAFARLSSRAAGSEHGGCGGILR